MRDHDYTAADGPTRQVDIEIGQGVHSPLDVGTLREVLNRALDAAAAPRASQVGLILVDDAEIAKLNVNHMGHQGPTDVLSFPLLPASAFPPHAGQDPEVRAIAQTASAQSPGFVLPPSEPVHLGEVVVSVQRAIVQARLGRGGHTGDVRWSPADELRLLVTHGALHLCGWDHALPEEEAAMRMLERRLLAIPD